MAPVFDPNKCPVPEIEALSDFVFIEDCSVPYAPEPIYDCSDTNIDMPLPAPVGIPGTPGGPGDPGAPGGGGGNNFINTTVNFGGNTTVNFGGSTTTNFNGTIFYPPGSTINVGVNINNLTLPTTLFNVLNVTANVTLSGIGAASANGLRLVFVNAGTGILTIPNESSDSDAANRFRCPYSQDLLIPPNFAFEIQYDTDISRWRVWFVSDILNPGVNQTISLSGQLDDFSFDRGTPSLVFDLSAAATLTGISGGVPGYLLRIAVIHLSPALPVLTIKHLDSDSVESNRIVTPAGEDFLVSSGGGVLLLYDGESGYWRVIATVPTYTTPERVLVVGDNFIAEEKANLLFQDDYRLQIEVRDGLGDRPELAGVLTGSSNGDLIGAEEVFQISGYGRVSGSDVLLSGMEMTYQGTGGDQTGSITVFAYENGVRASGWTVHKDGDLEIHNANTASKFLATDSDGHVVTVDTPSPSLTATHIGFGSGSNVLSGNSNLTYDGTLVKMKVPSPGGYRVEGYATASTSLAKFIGGHADGSGGTPATTTDGRILSRFGAVRYNGGWQDETAVIDFVAANSSLADLIFRTGGTSPTDRFGILNGGELRCYGLTADRLVGTDGDKDLTSIAVDGSLSLSGGTLSVTNPATGTNSGDQNVFSTIAVSGEDDVVADSTTDTLTLAAGTGISITTDAATDTITITATGASYTDEEAQDAVGAMVADTSTIDVTYTDATPELKWDVKDSSITFAKMQAITDGRLLGASGGTAVEEITPTLGVGLSGNNLVKKVVGCRIHRTTDQSINNATWTAVSFTAEGWDTNTFHDNATNPSRITIPAGYGGTYRINGALILSTTSAATLIWELYKNADGVRGAGTLLGTGQGFPGAFWVDWHPYTEAALADGDRVEVFVIQGTGAAVNISGTEATCWLMAERMGD